MAYLRCRGQAPAGPAAPLPRAEELPGLAVWVRCTLPASGPPVPGAPTPPGRAGSGAGLRRAAARGPGTGRARFERVCDLCGLGCGGMRDGFRGLVLFRDCFHIRVLRFLRLIHVSRMVGFLAGFLRGFFTSFPAGFFAGFPIVNQSQ